MNENILKEFISYELAHRNCKKVNKSMRIYEETIEKIRKIAKTNNLKESEVIGLAIEKYFEMEE